MIAIHELSKINANVNKKPSTKNNGHSKDKKFHVNTNIFFCVVSIQISKSTSSENV